MEPEQVVSADGHIYLRKGITIAAPAATASCGRQVGHGPGRCVAITPLRMRSVLTTGQGRHETKRCSEVRKAFALRPGWLAVPAALVALLLFSAVAALNTAPAAKAEVGRRLCIYVENYHKAFATVQALKPSVGGTGMTSYASYIRANLTVVLNYKKDGKCPDAYTLTIDGQTIPLSYPDSVPGVEQPKIDCEDIYTEAAVTGSYRGPSVAAAGQPNNPSLELETNQDDSRKGTDVCTKMDPDVLYAFWTIDEKVSLDAGGKVVEAVPGDFVTTRLWATRL
jgi:hypothetical protein